MSQLNDKQQQAVHHMDSPLLVIAGAGSGKTRVITQKIEWLITGQNLAPEQVTAVTFTNKSANEMRVRLSEMMGKEASEKVRISTFHRLGLEIIRSALELLGLRPGFSIFDNKDSEKVIQDIADQTMDKDSLARLQHQISSWKSQGRDSQHPAGDANASDWEVYQKYEERLHLYNAVDFDDLLLKPLFLLRNSEAVLTQWRDTIRYLLVDEYQDTNVVQYEMVQLLVQASQALTVVGDDDQSIYAWRGAEQENLLKLQEDFPTLKIVKLEQNYRSVGRVLKAANTLIANNQHLFEKNLWSALGFGEPIRVVKCKNEIHEAEKTVADLLYQRLSKGYAFEDFAILYRSNYQARLFEQALRGKSVPYILSGGRSFFDYAEIKDVMAYMKILVNPDDDAAFLRVVNTPRRGIGKSTIDKIAHYAKSNSLGLFYAAEAMGEADLSKRAYANLRVFMDYIVRAQDHAERELPKPLIEDLLQEVHYQEWLTEQAETEEAGERKWKNVLELLSWVGNIQKKRSKCVLKDVIQHITLMDMLENQKEDKAVGVSLMTLHAAKGLEFNHVYLVGMEEELLPHKSSVDGSLEEERRLAYVGITRAKETLTLSMAAVRRRYGETVRCAPSRFLKELPQEDLDYVGEGVEVSEEEQKNINQVHLANLKAQFGK